MAWRARKKETTTAPPRRSQWRGVVSFGLINIPVMLIPALRKGSDLHFRLLDKKNNGPIGYKQINKVDGREVPRDRIVKGYEYEPDQFVIVTDEDFEQANPKATHSIDIEDFVNKEELDFLYLQKPYYLWPGKNGEKAYALLRQALEQAHKVAIAEIVLQKKQHLCAVVPRGPFLMLELLYYAHELDQLEKQAVPEAIEQARVTPKELQMAEALIKGMASHWKPDKYHDTFYEDLKRRIEAKAKKGQLHEIAPVEEAPTPNTNVVDLMPLLQKSLQAAESAHASSRPKGHAKKSRKAKHA